MIFDLHTHHQRCGHARGALREYVEAAIDAGLDIIGLSDHTPQFGDPRDHPLPGVSMAKSQFDGYLAEAFALREEFRGRIEVLVAVESDYYPEHEARYREILSAYQLDYVIGSVHVLDGIDLFRPDRWVGLDDRELRGARERYCDMVARSAGTKIFDVLGHIDVIKAVCPRIAEIDTPAVDRMVQEIARADVVVEINTSGKTKECGGWYPSYEILERARRYGVKVTFGSDAHDPERVGDEHEEVRALLRELGYREWFAFRDRQRIAFAL